MPLKLPSDLGDLVSPVGTDILIAQRLPEQAARQLTIADILALVSTVPPDGSISTLKLADSAVTTAKIADSTISTIKLADHACTNMSYASAGQKTLTGSFDGVCDLYINLQTPYSYVIVLGFFSGYGSRSSGTGAYGAEIDLRIADGLGGIIMAAGFAGFANGGYSGAATIGSSTMIAGIYQTGLTPGTVQFRLNGKYVTGSTSGLCTGAKVFAFEMKR